MYNKKTSSGNVTTNRPNTTQCSVGGGKGRLQYYCLLTKEKTTSSLLITQKQIPKLKSITPRDLHHATAKVSLALGGGGRVEGELDTAVLEYLTFGNWPGSLDWTISIGPGPSLICMKDGLVWSGTVGKKCICVAQRKYQRLGLIQTSHPRLFVFINAKLLNEDLIFSDVGYCSKNQSSMALKKKTGSTICHVLQSQYFNTINNNKQIRHTIGRWRL